MIVLERFGVRYPGAAEPALAGVDLVIEEGELVLVAGPTGSGKSTLLRALNGLVPHFTGGHVEGRVVSAGLDTRLMPPRELAEHVGYVGQDPMAGFVTETVAEELAYGMEQLGLAPAVMRRRVEETLDLLGLAPLRRRALRTLSGGEQQRVAIGAALTSHPRVLVLDEPTSALDPAAAEEVLSALLRLVHDLGVTAVVAEHRMERVVEYADRVVVVDGAGVQAGEPRQVLAVSPVRPPVVELGRMLEWDPLPLSVRDARRRAGPVRDEVDGNRPTRRSYVRTDEAPVLEARGVVVRHGATVALRGVDVAVAAGEVLAVMGRNGSGKSSLLWALSGRRRPSNGTVQADGTVVLVPQEASDLLYLETVEAECAAADRGQELPAGTTRSLLDRLAGPAGQVPGDKHPRDLSEGQRLCLVLALQLGGAPAGLLLDEPTRGLDYAAKRRLTEIVSSLAADGCAVVLATHDVEFVAQVADRVVVLADGDVVTDASIVEAIASSPTFAPQVAKVLAPLPILTVQELADVLG